MAEYLWACGNGKIISANYDRGQDTLSNEQVLQELKLAFQQFGHLVECQSISNQLSEVYRITFINENIKDIIVCAKGTTPGGRKNLNDEQRTQQKSKYINYAYSELNNGKVAIQLGVYKRDNQTVFCAWKLKESSAAEETPISKQIKINTIAKAMKEGFAQQDKGGNEYACAFRKEFIYFYIKNVDWIHNAPTNDFVKHNLPVKDDNETLFRFWLKNLLRDNGEHYSENTIMQYISAIKAASNRFIKYIEPFQSIFEIDDVKYLINVVADIKKSDDCVKFNQERGNGALLAGLDLYKRFLMDQKELFKNISFNTGYKSLYSHNRIIFGAPGTGKSFSLNQEKNKLLLDGGEYERVTFHPDYTYANFVGTYKPVPCKDIEGKDIITYAYVPGPFMRIYVKALKNSRSDVPKPFLLLIEEINRANVAAVFGDVFQLLDRDNDGVSEYPIQASDDVRSYLARELGGIPDDYAEIRIPDNMFIWATMNSADQGVFPMDTAFKRRWDFTYLSIDDGESEIAGKKVIIGEGNYRRMIEWNILRKAINNELLSYRVNEDKLIGPYFISKKYIKNGNIIDTDIFLDIFKSKIIMYLFEDAAKQKRTVLFSGCDENEKNQYSKICKAFETKGVYIFCKNISNQFNNDIPEDD